MTAPDDYISLADDDSVNPDYITVSTWFNKHGNGSTGHSAFVGKWDNTSNDRSYYLGDFQDNETVDFCVSSDGSNYLCEQTPSYSENQWYHVAATWDGTDIAIYIDGVKQTLSSAASSGTPSGGLV